MRPMPRTLPSLHSKYPMHTVDSSNRSKDKSGNMGGITFSFEKPSNEDAARAERDVLRSILLRESYLERLKNEVRTIAKKFKPEVADVLDLLRSASLDVIESIEAWRKVKEDPDATFVWNGIHYLLKMPSDLDYLSEYIAVQRWMGFPLIRNPFCIPFAMDLNPDPVSDVNSESLLSPQHVKGGVQQVEGFTVGGPLSAQPSNSNTNTSEQQSKRGKKKTKKGGDWRSNATTEAQSFILNEDMKRIRWAEFLIMKAEQRFGKFMRDPDGNLVPYLQALTRKAALELKKDDRRSINEPSTTSLMYAPHAAKSEIGIADAAWTPDIQVQSSENDADDGGRRMTVPPKSIQIKNPDGTICDAVIEGQDMNAEETKYINSRQRGKAQIGGELLPLNQRGSESRRRRPIKPSVSSEMDFQRNRKILSLESRLQEIRKLKEELNRAQSAGEILSITERKDGIVRSSLSGQRLGVSKSVASINPTVDNNPQGTSLHINEGKSGLPKEYFGNVEGAMNGDGLRPQQSQPYLDPRIDPNSNVSVTSDSAGPKVQAVASMDASSVGSSAGSIQGLSIKELRKLRKIPSTSQSVDVGEESVSNPSSPAHSLISRSISGKRILPSIKSSNSQVSDSRIPSEEDLEMQKKEELLRIEQEMEQQKAKEIRKEMEHVLSVEEAKAQRHHDHYQTDILSLGKLKFEERDLRARENSMQIERKRRKLSQAESKRAGLQQDERPNVYDYYAVRIQSAIRGWLARCWIRWYRAVLLRATRLLQAILRGWLARVRVKRLKRRHNAAVAIQKTFRGWSTRGTSAEMARKQSLLKMAVVIQRYWRGFLGRRRAKNKISLDTAAKQAFEAVDPLALVASDVKELGRRITYALDEPLSTSLPPDEVLDLIRLAVMVVQAGRGPLGIADYDNLQIRHYQELDGAKLNWRQAGKIMNRSERFIRLVRVVAFGCGAKPPRLIQLSDEGNRLFMAQSNNPYWNIRTFETMGLGSRICCQLFKWLSSMVEVSKRQQEFLSLIATAFPDWLPKLQEQQRVARMCDFELELNRRAFSILDSSLDAVDEDNIADTGNDVKGTDLSNSDSEDEDGEEDPMLESKAATSSRRRITGPIAEITQKEMKLLRRALNESRARLRVAISEIDLIKKDQNSREVVALDAMKVRVVEANELLAEMAKQYAVAQELGAEGDRAAVEQCAELKIKLTNQRLKATELEAQAKLLEVQVESNKAKRSDGGNASKITPEILRRVIIAGEAKAAYLLASIQCQVMLKNANVKHATDLPFHLFDIYDTLHAKCERLRAESRKRYVEAETEKKIHDDLIQSSSAAQEVAEQKSKDRMMPTDEEMREDRDEDELESRFEKQKHLQFLPDHILYDRPGLDTKEQHAAGAKSENDFSQKTSFRPVLIALSRDLPQKAKQRILREIRVKLPGRFVVVDPPSLLPEDTYDPERNMHASIPVIGEVGFEGTFRKSQQQKKPRNDLVTSCQAVLDAGRHVITFFNHGLTRMTRDTFLNSLDVLLQALFPRPSAVLVVGDEANSRRGAFLTLNSSSASYDTKLLEDYRCVSKLLQHECGVAPSDMQMIPNAIDREIKGALQTQSHIALRFLYERALNMACMTCFQYEPNRRLPPSHNLALVLEAIYILFNEDKTMTDDLLPVPSHDRVVVTWRLTKLLLASPQNLGTKMQQLRRGSVSVRRLAVIKMQYKAHPLWPTVENRADTYPVLYESPMSKATIPFIPSDDFDAVRADLEEDKNKPGGYRSQRDVSDVKERLHENSLLPAHANAEIVTAISQANVMAQNVGMSIEMAVKLLCDALCEFIDSVLRCEEATLAGGGVPLQSVTLKNSMQGVSTVVTVGDGTRTRSSASAFHTAAQSVDVEQACSQILRATLQDKRVLKTVARLEFHSPLSINNGMKSSSSLRKQTSVDSERRYGVAMYRDQDRIFAEAYDADTQFVYMTSIPIVEVPSLLMPSHSDTKVSNKSADSNTGPPASSEEMYRRLLRLLRFEALSSQRRKVLNLLSTASETTISVRTRELVCRRDHSLLYQIVRVIQGHRCLIRFYTSGPGDLLVTVYLTEYARVLQLRFGVAERQRMALNYHDLYRIFTGSAKKQEKIAKVEENGTEENKSGDFDDNEVEYKLLLDTTHNVDAILPLPRRSVALTDEENGDEEEKNSIESRPQIPIERETGQGGGDIRELIPYLLDRLQIHPPKHFIDATFPQNPYGKESEFYTGAIQPVRVSSAAMVLRDKEESDQTTKGSGTLIGSASSIQLHLRTQGTSGRVLFRSTFHIAHLRCILQVKEISSSQRLWISLYEPRSRHTMSLQLEPFHRHAILSEPLITQREGTPGHSRDRIMAWKKILQDKLRLHWWEDQGDKRIDKQAVEEASGIIADSTILKKPSPSQQEREVMRYGRISLDDTIVRRVISIQSVRYLFSVACSGEHEATMTLYDSRFSRQYESKISPSELRLLIHTQTAAEVAQQASVDRGQPNNSSADGREQSNMQPGRIAKNLDFMRGVVVGGVGNAVIGTSGAISTGEMRSCCYVHDLLCHSGHISTLCQKLSWYLSPVIDQESTQAGLEKPVKYLQTKTPPCPLNIVFRESRSKRPKESPVPKVPVVATHVSTASLAKQGTGLEGSVSMSMVIPSEKSLLSLRPYYRNLYPLHLQRLHSLHPKDPVERIREEEVRKQLYAIVRMEDELNALAVRKEQEAQNKLSSDTELTKALFESDDNELAIKNRPVIADDVLEYGVGAVMDELVQSVVLRVLKLNSDGTPANDPAAEPSLVPAPIYPLTSKKLLSQETLIDDASWTKLFDVGVKANFRDGRVTWQAHVSMTIHRALCWSTYEGLSCQYKFKVYDPATAQYYEGLVRDVKHLREVLGIYGKDLLVTPNQIKAVGDLSAVGDKLARDPKFDDPFEVLKPHPEKDKLPENEYDSSLPPREEDQKLQEFDSVTKSSQILRHRQRELEMVLFICRHRLELVTNKKLDDPAALFSGLSVISNAPAGGRNDQVPVGDTNIAPPVAVLEGNTPGIVVATEPMEPYHIEFRADRLYSSDKVTPVNAGTEEDDAINNQNEQKLVDIEHARGKKIVRLVRRVSGLLLQLTVFELPSDVARGAMVANPVPGYEHLLSEDGPVAAGIATNESNALVASAGFDKSRIDPEKAGFAEVRGNLDRLVRFLPPAFRIVGYDPRSKKKIVLAVPPQAVLEVCGGPFSPYLDPEIQEKRRYLARVVCESLILYFPASGQFQLVVPWSGSRHLLSNAEVSAADTKKNAPIGSVRSSAERVLQRSGRIFRAVVKVGKYELLLSLYTHRLPRKDRHSRPGTRTGNEQGKRKKKSLSSGEEENLPDYVRLTAESLEEEARRARGENIEEQEDIEDDEDADEELLIFNFYSPAVSQASELVVDEEQQRARHPQQRLILSYPEGAIRATVIRRFVREFVNAEIIEDLVDPTIKTLHTALRDPKKGYVTDYQTMGIATPGDDLRPIGIPDVFFPLDSCGLPVHRRGMRLQNLHYPTTKPAYKDVLITVYTKSKIETPERGLIVKVYDRSDCQTSILHVGASELIRLCNFHRQPDLLRDLVTAQDDERSFGAVVGTESSTLVKVNSLLQPNVDDNASVGSHSSSVLTIGRPVPATAITLALDKDDISRSFSAFTEQGEREAKTKALRDLVVDIVLQDLAFFIGPQDQLVPCIKSHPLGTAGLLDK